MTIHVHDLEDMTKRLNAVTFGRNTAKGTHNEARDGSEAAGAFTWEATHNARGFAEIIK